MGPGQVCGGPNPDRNQLLEKGGALRVRGSAQAHHPGGVAAKVSGREGTNPPMGDLKSPSFVRVEQLCCSTDKILGLSKLSDSIGRPALTGLVIPTESSFIFISNPIT